MCGIAGIIDPTLSRVEGEALMDRMLESIRHRGPDNSSTWFDMSVLLGHNRLSIIDLTDAANQPMEYDDLVIVYNGEVYNYIEIKDELVAKGYRFRTDSDTEVVLAAYKEWGGDCVQRFVGMWAFAIWDKCKKELFCSRDRFGIKPFYYIHAGDKFYFGSEYKPLKLSPLFDGKLNHAQIRRGLLLDMLVCGEETYFERINILPEKCNLIFKDSRLIISEYWDLDPVKKFSGTWEDKTSRFQYLFKDSIKLHTRSHVEVSACLSGGLDSSSIVSVMAAGGTDSRLKTFTIYYEGDEQMDERRWVREVLERYPQIEPIYYAPSNDEVATIFDHTLKLHDVPFFWSPAISYYFVMRLVKQQGIKVVIDGQGADEYLAGYLPYFTSGKSYVGAPKEAGKDSTSNNVRSRGRTQAFNDKTKKAIPSPSQLLTNVRARHAEQYLANCTQLGWNYGRDISLKHLDTSPLKQYLYRSLFLNPMPLLLHNVDRMSMASSIECRVPFLDHRLVEFVYSLNDEDIVIDGQSKVILRGALRDNLPSAIFNRHDKQPFRGAEPVKWLRGALAYLTEQKFDFDQLNILNREKVTDLLHKFRRGDNSGWEMVWKLVVLNSWANRQ